MASVNTFEPTVTAAMPCESSPVAALSFVPLGHVISCPCCRKSTHTTTTTTTSSVGTGPVSPPSYPEPTGFVCTQATQLGLEWGLDDDGAPTYICTGELPPSTWGLHDVKDAAKANVANGFQKVLDLMPTVARSREFDPKNRGHVTTCNGRWVCEDPGALVDDSISMGCSQAPIDIALQLNLPDPSGNAFICTTETVQPSLGRRGDAAAPTLAKDFEPTTVPTMIATPSNRMAMTPWGHVISGSCKIADMIDTDNPGPTATDDAVGIACTAAPADVAVTLQPADDGVQSYLCTADSTLQAFGIPVATPNSTTLPSLQPSLGAHTIAATVLTQSLESGSSGVFALLFIAAMCSTLFYWWKYHQVLAASRTPTAVNKPKVQ